MAMNLPYSTMKAICSANGYALLAYDAKNQLILTRVSMPGTTTKFFYRTARVAASGRATYDVRYFFDLHGAVDSFAARRQMNMLEELGAPIVDDMDNGFGFDDNPAAARPSTTGDLLITALLDIALNTTLSEATDEQMARAGSLRLMFDIETRAQV
jgi:hypothetical protein